MGSELRQIQDEILRRFKRPRTTVDDIPGYAGGNLGEQLDREGQSPDRMSRVRSSVFAPPRQPQEAQLSQPTGQARSVFAPPSELGSEFTARKPVDVSEAAPIMVRHPGERPGHPTLPARKGMIGDGSQEDRDRAYSRELRDYTFDLETQPRNWKDKTVDALRVANQAFGSNPNIFTPTKQEREILKAQGMLGRDIAIQREQTQQQLAQMVPIYDANGNVIGSAPRRTAVSNQIRATDVGTRAGETKRRNDAYIADIEHKDTLAADKQLSLDWAKGLFDDDPDMLAYVGKKKKMDGPAPRSNQGQLVTDEGGNFAIVRKGAATAETVKDATTGKPKQSWVITKEQRVDDRARRSQAAALERAYVIAAGTSSRLGDPDVLDTIANEAQANETAATTKAEALSKSDKPSDKKLAGQYLSEAGRHRAQAIRAREAATKARSGQNFGGGTQTRGKRTLAGAIEAFRASQNRDPTPEEISRMKAHLSK